MASMTGPDRPANLKGMAMLVLQRQWNQSVMIGDDIEIVIVRLNENSVRLGFNAPPKVPIHRKEIWEAIQREKEARDDTRD
jgi:carbon storage regulator